MSGNGNFSNLTGLFLQPNGSYDLARLGLACTTVSTVLRVYANYRQLRHMASPAYRPPLRVKALLSQEKIDHDSQDRSNDRGMHKIRRSLHMQIGAAVAGWLKTGVLILGGYDTIFKFSRKVAANAPKWLNGGEGTLTSTLLSSAVYFCAFPMIGLAASFCLSYGYRKWYPIPGDIPGLRGQMMEPVRSDSVKFPRWKIVLLSYASGVIAAGVPGLALTTIYERLGPERSTSLSSGMLWVGGTGLVVLDGSLAIWMIYSRYRNKTRPLIRPERQHLYSSVSQWKAKNDVAYDVELLERKIQAVLFQRAAWSHLPLEVMVREEEEEKEEEIEIMGTVMEPDEHPALNENLVPSYAMCSDKQFLGLHARQLRELDFEQNLALAASQLTGSFSSIDVINGLVIPQATFALMLLPYPLLHLLYVERPSLVRDIFPSLSPFEKHIPLVVSWSTTSSILPELFFVIKALGTSVQNRQAQDKDKKIVTLGSEYARGWTSLLEARASTKERKEERADVGTCDTFYGWVYGNTLRPTRRLLEMQKYL